MSDQAKLCEAAEDAQRIQAQMAQLGRKLTGWCDEEPVEPPTTPRVGPPLDEITVLSPGTRGVLGWEPILDLDITVEIVGKELIVSWPDELGDWPTVMRDLSAAGRIPYMGVTGIVYRPKGAADYLAYPAEYLRPRQEATGTRWHWEDKFRQAARGMPAEGSLIAIFLASMWRHWYDNPKHTNRTLLKYFKLPELELVGSE